MSDKPILTRAEEILERPDVKAMPTVKVPICVSCGGYHGSAAVALRCVSEALVKAKEELGKK